MALPRVIPGFFFFSFLFSSPFSGGLPRVNTRVFFLNYFFRPFPASCPGLIPGFSFFPPFPGGLPKVNTRVFLFFFFTPFPGGFAVYGRTGLCIFQMALPRVNTRVFFFFFALFRRATQG